MNIILNTDPIENRGAMVATVGLFDGVHLGHRHIINALRLRAAALGAQSMVVTFDQHPQHILAPDKEPVKQISSILDRVNRLNEAQVDNMLVFAFEDIVLLTAREFIIKLRDDYGVVSLVMGYDNHIGSDRADASQCEALGEELGVSVARISKAPLGDVSSTLIRHAIAHDGDMLKAHLMLGHPFAIYGTVIHGERQGTAMGFPTANVGELSSYQLMPKLGAYAVVVELPDTRQHFPGMAGVSLRPTFALDPDDANSLSVEVNIFADNVGDIYGNNIIVYFIDRLRDEMKFDSPEALGKQLEQDRAKAMEKLQQFFSN